MFRNCIHWLLPGCKNILSFFLKKKKRQKGLDRSRGGKCNTNTGTWLAIAIRSISYDTIDETTRDDEGAVQGAESGLWIWIRSVVTGRVSYNSCCCADSIDDSPVQVLPEVWIARARRVRIHHHLQRPQESIEQCVSSASCRAGGDGGGGVRTYVPGCRRCACRGRRRRRGAGRRRRRGGARSRWPPPALRTPPAAPPSSRTGPPRPPPPSPAPAGPPSPARSSSPLLLLSPPSSSISIDRPHRPLASHLHHHPALYSTRSSRAQPDHELSWWRGRQIGGGRRRRAHERWADGEEDGRWWWWWGHPGEGTAAGKNRPDNYCPSSGCRPTTTKPRRRRRVWRERREEGNGLCFSAAASLYSTVARALPLATVAWLLALS